MSSNENSKASDVSSQNSLNNDNNSSSKYLLHRNSTSSNNNNDSNRDIAKEKNENTTSPIDNKKEIGKSMTQTSIRSYEKRNSITSATVDAVSLNFNSDSEYIDITNIKNKKQYDTENFTSLSHKNEQPSYLRDDTLSRSNILKNYCYDICIPLDKKGGTRNVEDFYEIDYDKFQHFCDNSTDIKNKDKNDYDMLHRRKSSFSLKGLTPKNNDINNSINNSENVKVKYL